MVSAGSASIFAAFLLLCCACSSSAGLFPYQPPLGSPSLGSSYATGLFRAQPNGLTLPSPPGFASLTYVIVDWNITLSDNLCNHVIKAEAFNSTLYVDKMTPIYINQTCGFTRNQQITLAGDNSASNVFQQSGSWGQGSTLALYLSKRIEGVWPFSQHYTDSTLQNIDQLTIAFQGSQSFAGLSNTIAFTCVGNCTPPVLP